MAGRHFRPAKGGVELFVRLTPRASRDEVGGIETAADVPDVLRRLAFDPQTSGGLLLAVESGATGHLLGRLADAGVEACVVGQVDPPDARGIRVRLA